MGELHTGSQYPLCDADQVFYSDLHVVTPGYKTKGKGNCGYLAQHKHAYFGLMGLVSLGRLQT